MARTTMNDADKAALKAAILADPALAPMTSGPTTDYNGLVTACNAPSATDAWRLAMPPVEIDDAPNYANFDSIVPGKRESWGFLLQFPRDFSRNKVRKWVTDIWGNATAGSDAEAILLAALEKATYAQVKIGGSSKTTGTVTGLDRNFAGTISLSDIVEMFNV